MIHILIHISRQQDSVMMNVLFSTVCNGNMTELDHAQTNFNTIA